MSRSERTRELPAARTWPSIFTIALGAAVGLGTLVMELLYRLPPLPSDQINYLDAAREFPGVPTEFHYTITSRIGVVLPMRALMAVFGYGEAAYYIVAMVAGIALAVAVFVLGTLLFNRAVGVAAAALTTGCSVVFPDLTQPLADPVATALFCWAVVLAVALRQHRPETSSTSRRETVTLIVIGALLGWSYLAREFIVFVWPLIPLVLFGRVKLKRMLWIVAPLAVVGLGEAALNAYMYGDPLLRLHAASGHADVLAQQPYGVKVQGRRREWMLTRFVAILGQTPEGVFLKAALVAMIAGAIRSRRLRFLAAWAALLWIPLTLLGGFVNPSEPILELAKARFWLPIVPAVLLAGVGALYLLVRSEALRYPRLRVRAALLASCVTLVGVALPVAIAQKARMDDPAYLINRGDLLGELRAWLVSENQQVRLLRADPRTTRVLAVSMPGAFGVGGWDGKVTRLNRVTEATPGEYVVRYAAPDACWQCAKASKAVFGEQARTPPAWELAFEARDRSIQVFHVPTQ